MIIVSACLCGINCKYNGKNNLNDKILELLKQNKVLPICPEQLGGMTTPRKPCEIINGHSKDVLNGKASIINCDKKDCTQFYIRGAYEALKIAKAVKCEAAILKYKSPSCGLGKVYDGSFSNNLVDGNGITAELFLKNNIKVYTENDIELLFK